MNGAGKALFGGTLVAVVTSFPYVLHLREALPGGVFDGPRQLLLWLPWQLHANVHAGRGLFECAAFPVVAHPLLEIIGNPGAALLLAPLHALGEPVLAWNLGILLLGASNAIAAWWLASTVRGAAPWLAALLVSGAWGWSQLSSGATPVGWLAPGLVAAALARTDHARASFALGLLGALTAPLPTAICLLWSGHWGRAAACVGALMMVPPLGATGELPGFTLGSLSWPGAGATVALPLATLGLLAVLASRKRPVLAAALALALVGAAGSVAVEAYSVRWPAFPAPRSIVAAVSLTALLTALPFLRPRGVLAPVLALLLAVEPTLQTRSGQPGTPWTGAVLNVPAVFARMDATRSGVLLQLPFGGVTEGAVGWIPFHHRPVTGGPGETRDGLVREAMRAAIARDPVFQAASLAVESNEPVALRGGWEWALLYGDDTESRRRARAVFGEPTTTEPGLWAWKLR